MRIPLVAAVLILAAPAARADGLYFTEQFGGAHPTGRLGHYFDSGFAGRIAGGANLGGWAVEAYVQLFSFETALLFDQAEYTATTLGVDVRRLFPVSPWLRLYLRAGVGHTAIDDDAWAVAIEGRPSAAGYEGRGFDYGAGVMASGRLPAIGFLFPPLFLTDWGPKVSAGAWFDLGEQVVWLHKPDATSLPGAIQTWMLGFSIGGGF